MCILAFKAIHGLAPTYLTSLVSVKRSSIYSLRSEKNEVLIESACNVRSTKKTLGDRALTAAVPSVFNALPRHIHQENKFNSFKTLLKTHFFKIAKRINISSFIKNEDSMFIYKETFSEIS